MTLADTQRAAWRGTDLSGGREWVYELTAGDIDDLCRAVEVVRAAGWPLETLRRDRCRCPCCRR
jgi:hypothetical protein